MHTQEKNRLWLDKCISYQAAFVPFNEKLKGWATVGGGVIKDEKKAQAYAKRLNRYLKGAK